VRASILALALLAACHGEPSKDVVVDTEPADSDVVVDTERPADTDAPADSDAVDSDLVDTDAGTDTDGHTGPVPTSCKEAGGICTSSALCGSNLALTSFAADCAFDDGPGVCCLAPPERPTGDTCSARGGVCAPIAGCGFVDGWLWLDRACQNAGGVGTTCCLPEAACGPEQDECCNDDHSTSYRASCDRGVVACEIPDTTLVPLGTCITP
jgi:hypothetical protein